MSDTGHESPFEPVVLALGEALRDRGWTIATAESCTGGLLAATCTSVAGSSEWFEGGFITYSYASKQQLLDVARELLERHGAVSAEVACAMAQGAIARSRADLSIAITGIAGPGGATPAKPVGTVWLALAQRHVVGARARLLQLQGDRASVRSQSVAHALAALCEAVGT